LANAAVRKPCLLGTSAALLDKWSFLRFSNEIAAQQVGVGPGRKGALLSAGRGDGLAREIPGTGDIGQIGGLAISIGPDGIGKRGTPVLDLSEGKTKGAARWSDDEGEG
jgi:hypothetical protein